MNRSFRRYAVEAARAAAEKHATDIRLFEVAARSSVTDYMLLSSIESPFQMEAVCRKIEEVLEEKGLEPLRCDGTQSAVWKVLDYGGMLIHVMHVRARDFYGLDRLYGYAKKVPWQPRASRSLKH